MRMRQAVGLSFGLLVLSATAEAEAGQSVGSQTPPPVVPAQRAATAAAPATFAGHWQSARPEAVRTEPTRPYDGARRAVAQPAAPDRYIPAAQQSSPLRLTGKREIGRAAWYGGRRVGRLTATGERLDVVRATCAHRSLPLHSLVRVTNLNNGRSVVAVVNDRGPVSRSLLIDLSPRAADALDMKRAGIVPVVVETVAATTPARY